MKAVSYTHLDVYKRQTLNEALTAQLFKDGHSLKNAEIAKARKASAEGTHSLYPLLWSYYTDRFADGKTYAEMVDIAQQVGNTDVYKRQG